MQISFFEEFPTKTNLDKIKHVNFPTKLFIGARSLKQFNEIKVNSKFVKEKIYWPLLSEKEGYWFSAFTENKAIDRTINDLNNSEVPIMIDAELPTHHNPTLFLTQSLNFLSNRKKLRRLIKNRKDVYTAEYFPSSSLSEIFFNSMALNFRTKNHKPIKMIYSSMHDFGEKNIRKILRSAKSRYRKRLCVGLGTLTHGIIGTEPVIDPKILERDLKICQDLKINEVILFRLGGVNKRYKKILEKFST